MGTLLPKWPLEMFVAFESQQHTPNHNLPNLSVPGCMSYHFPWLRGKCFHPISQISIAIDDYCDLHGRAYTMRKIAVSVFKVIGDAMSTSAPNDDGLWKMVRKFMSHDTVSTNYKPWIFYEVHTIFFFWKRILQVPDTGTSQYWWILEHFWCTRIARNSDIYVL